MITSFDGHWDRVYNDVSYYWNSMIHVAPSLRKEGTPTIFIKVEKGTGRPEKAWLGFVDDFRGVVKQKKDSIAFKVHINQTVPLPDKYRSYPSGWYLEPEALTTTESPLEPPFFDTLKETRDWDEFERLSYTLLKLLGINEIHTFKKQRGRPDGWFKIGGLAVQYDATLETDFLTSKHEQMRNYSSQLTSGSLEHEEGTVNVRDCSKNVWIITRGTSRRITKFDSVTVKEVAASDLMRVYRERVEKNLSEDQLVSVLGTIS